MNQQKALSIKGRIENVVYCNEHNDYTVLEIVEGEDNLVCAVGIIPMAAEGEQVTLFGRWVYHKEYGKQFAFDSFEKTRPEETDGIMQYLSSGTIKGIGPVTALKIVNRFGDQTFEVIEYHPEWLTDIPGITMKKAAAISESFRQQSGLRGVMMFCKDYIGASETTRVYKKFGAGAVGLIQQNPYILCDRDLGIPFNKVDAMAMTLGIASDSCIRILNGIKYVLNHNGGISGHTCLPTDTVIKSCAELLDISSEAVGGIIDLLLDEGELSCYEREEINYIMTNETAEAEDYIAKRLWQMNENTVSLGTLNISSLIEKVEGEMGVSFAPMQ